MTLTSKSNEDSWGFHFEEALKLIKRLHIPDQPAAFDVSELDWAKRHVATLRRIASKALAGEDFNI